MIPQGSVNLSAKIHVAATLTALQTVRMTLLIQTRPESIGLQRKWWELPIGLCNKWQEPLFSANTLKPLKFIPHIIYS
eukprot:8679647-Ditylum_brightwellii.AAC.1